MTVGILTGAVQGAVYGFQIGNVYGAVIGAVVGAVVGGVVEAAFTPDIQNQGLPDAEQNLMSAEIGGPVTDVCGTAKITGQLLAYGLERNVITYSESSGGKGGGGSQKQETGREYYMTWALGLVACPDNPVNSLYAIYKNDDIEPVWSGTLNCPASGGKETIIIDGIGSLDFYFGTDDQMPNTAMGNIINDSTLNSPLRYLCWVVFDDCYIGKQNRTPTYKFMLQKNPVIPELTGNSTIQGYRSNPAHVMWYILHNLAGLPTSWLNTAAFQTLADTLYNEDRGICVQFSRQDRALSFVENINGHIDNILLYNTDGQFHPKLIRDDYTFANLPVVTESEMLDDPKIQSASFIDTINENKVQYTELVNPPDSYVPFSTTGQWVAALSQTTTDFIYLYDEVLKAVMQVKLDDPPLLTNVLYLDPLYDLDTSTGYQGAQKGGYCINKSNTRLWYLLRTGNDCELIEVDISTSKPSLVKKTNLPSLISGEVIMDGCADDNFTYWGTNLGTGRIIKLKNSDHSIEDNHLFTLNKFTCSTNEQGITQLDVLPSTGKLFWNYVLEGCPGVNACMVRVRSDISFNIEIEIQSCGIGFNTPWNQNLLQIHDDFVFTHRAYYPSTGRMEKWTDKLDDSPDYTYSDQYNVGQDYLLNMLGKHSSYFFTFWRTNNVTPSYRLQCLDFTTLASVDDLIINTYIGDDRTSALNNGLLALVRYDSGENANYIATFTADNNITLVSDTKMDSLFIEGSGVGDFINFKKSISDPPAVDQGNIAIQGRTVPKTVQFGLFVDNDNAVWAANNLLQKSSYPLLPISFTANRNLFRLQPGDTFRCNYAPYDMVDMVVRVLSIEQEDMNSENIIVTGIQDFFSVTRYATNLGTPIDNAIGPPDYDCDPFVDQDVFEVPWVLSNSVQVIPVASRLTSLIIGFSVYMSLDVGASYNILTSSSNIQPYGELSQDYGLTYAIDRDEGIYIDFKNDADSIENQTFDSVLSGSKNMAILGGTEIISFQNITPVTSTIYKLENIIRGRWGTVREEHSIGDGFWFIQKNIELLNDNQILTGATRKFKLVPYNSQKQGSIVAATPIDITIEGESQKPYEPNNFDANGESFNPLYVSGTDITLDWSPRVRGQGAGSMISGTPVVTNTDHEGLFRVEVWVSAAKVRETTAIDAITWDYTNAMNVSDNGTPAQEITFILFNYIIQDGITYESDGVTVICNKE